MSEPTVAKHGRHTNPYYAPAKGATESWAGKSTDKDRPDGKVSGIVERYAKHERASTRPIAMGWIKATRAQSIEYTMRSHGMRGVLVFGGAFAASGCGYLAQMFASSRHFDLFAAALVAAMVLSAVVFVAWTTRLELFSPSDEPTIFDRAHRKVYRLFRERQPGLLGLFKTWPLRVCEYEWDLIDAEHTATVATTGSTITRYHAIVFIIRRSADDPTIIDSFNIGNGMELGEQTVPAVWEHIRRFMEEGGPHLPPGERLTPAEPPHTLWQSLGAVGPFGPLYMAWWKERTAMQILAHVLLPLSVPFFLLWGIFNWLSYKTAYAVDWPEEIKQAVGPPLSAEAWRVCRLISQRPAQAPPPLGPARRPRRPSRRPAQRSPSRSPSSGSNTLAVRSNCRWIRTRRQAPTTSSSTPGSRCIAAISTAPAALRCRAFRRAGCRSRTLPAEVQARRNEPRFGCGRG